MIKVGITGQAGFIGTHLFNTLGLHKDRIQRVPFSDDYFESESKLFDFVKNSDVIFHLAGMNRHQDDQVLYDTNIRLVKQLLTACDKTGSKPHILFSSSTQEDSDNSYGRSKREGRLLLENWADKNKAKFTGLIIPNVFGPYGLPHYNSAVATFCHQLTHKETPRIEEDRELKLIYVGELVKVFIDAVNSESRRSIRVPHTASIKVSILLRKLESFKSDYFDHGIFPSLVGGFEKNLFNTFVGFIDLASHYPKDLKLRNDERGSFAEILRTNSGGQVSFSTTIPGATRGNHFHTRKAERFAVIRGKARIEMRRIGTDNAIRFDLDGRRPGFVDMPVWQTHNITNTGDEELWTVFWISEPFVPDDPDTYYEKV